MKTEKKTLWRKKMYSKENTIAYRKKQKKKNSNPSKPKDRKLSETDSSEKKKNKTYSHRAGDWVCILCNNHNYSFRDICNRCKKQTKSENLQQQLYLLQHQNENFNPNIYSQLINFNYPFYNGMNNNQNFNGQEFNFNGGNFKGQEFGNEKMNFNGGNFNGGHLNFENGNFDDEIMKNEKMNIKSFNSVFEDKNDFREGYDKDEKEGRTPFTDISINKSYSSEDKFLKLQNKIFFELEEKFEEYSTNDEEEFNEKENKILQFLNI